MISAKLRQNIFRRARRQGYYSQGKPLYLIWGKTWIQANMKPSPLVKKEN